MTDQLTLDALTDGDRISVAFSPPLQDPDLGSIETAEGELRCMIGKHFLIAHSLRRSWGIPPCIDLPQRQVSRISLLQTASEVKATRAAKARGEIVFPDRPNTAQDLERQLTTLAEMIEIEERGQGRRSHELILQMNDIAEIVGLAKRKRTYLRARARLGCDFHPWTWPDDRVYRIETVRPLPADFELQPSRRKDRSIRLEQAVRIFGEAEREVRRIASALRRAGYDARRPHPNAQELRVRAAFGTARTDFTIIAGSNGLWRAEPTPPQNKSQDRAQRRVLRSGALQDLKHQLGAIVMT